MMEILQFRENHGSSQLAAKAVHSPLTYTFTSPKTANYRLVMRMHQPLLSGEAHDKRNDVWVRLEGNYTSACAYPKDILETDHKFWGRGPNIWGSAHSLEAHVNGARILDKVVYGLIEGEQYTFTISGRAQGCSLDYIIFYEELLNLNVVNIDIAANNPTKYQPGLGLVEPEGIVIEPDLSEIREGTSLQFSAAFIPENSLPAVSWTSSDPEALSIDQTGLVQVLGAIGDEASIFVTSEINGIKDSITLSIVEWYPVPIDSITLSPFSPFIYTGGEVKMVANPVPAYADNQSLSWSVDDQEIANITAHGLITAITAGNTTVRVTADAYENVYAETEIAIEDFVEPFVDFDDRDRYLTNVYEVGDSIVVTASFHAGNNAIVEGGIKFWLRHLDANWQVIDEVFNDVETSISGTQSGISSLTIPLVDIKPTNQLPAGHFYFLFLTFSNSNGINVSEGIQPINIKAEEVLISNISFEQDTITLIEKEIIEIVPRIEPENASDKSVVWESMDTGIVSIDHFGMFSAHNSGTVTIICHSSTNSEIKDSLIVQVEELVELNSLGLDQTVVLLQPGESQQLNVALDPINATYQSISWSSSNSEVAAVTKDGLVTAVEEGSTTITIASIQYPEISVTAHIDVQVALSLNESLGIVPLIYPNPTSKFIKIDGLPHKDLMVQLIDLNGRVIKQMSNDVNGIHLPDNLKAGTYLLQIKGLKMKLGKIIVK